MGKTLYIFTDIIFLGIPKLSDTMDDMVQARNNMHERNKKIEQDKKSKTKKVKNFFFGCCKNK